MPLRSAKRKRFLTDQQRAKLREELLAFVGEERYRWFVSIVQGWDPGKGRLTWWQERLIEDFAKKTGRHLPADCNALLEIFGDEFPTRVLPLEEVPIWCEIEELSGGQAWGVCDGYRWYFRAKYGSWHLGLSLDPDIDPVRIDNDSQGFYKEELYGDGRSGASWISDGEARYFIVETLKAFRAKY